MWRHIRPAFCSLVLIGMGYAAYPLGTAVVLHTAIKSGNAELITGMVDWDGVRQSLKASILTRLGEQAQQRPSHPTLLQKVGFKLADYVAPRMVDYMIENRVTPQGFIQYMGPKPAELTAGAGAQPSGSMLERIRRAKFVDYDRFEFQVVDRFDPGKEFLAVFELKDFLWRLTRVEMLSLGRGA